MKMPEPDRKMLIEHHKKMAEAHSKMAACLKTDKPLRECQDEMRKSLPPPPQPPPGWGGPGRPWPGKGPGPGAGGPPPNGAANQSPGTPPPAH
jgi:hypothetical protein